MLLTARSPSSVTASQPLRLRVWYCSWGNTGGPPREALARGFELVESLLQRRASLALLHQLELRVAVLGQRRHHLAHGGRVHVRGARARSARLLR
jgi:hypothetical protein